MTIKFFSSPDSAYEIAPGLTPKEAQDAGLAVVEYSYSTNPPTPIFGRYKDAPKGAALGVTVDDTGGTKVVGAGGPAFTAASPGGDKGSLLNTNDPIIHGGTGDESVHADNAQPLTDDAAHQEALLREGAVDASQPDTGAKTKK